MRLKEGGRLSRIRITSVRTGVPFGTPAQSAIKAIFAGCKNLGQNKTAKAAIAEH